MEVKAGYKHTEIGVIPEDWRIETIGRLIDEQAILGHLDGNHGELYPRSNEFKSYGVPYIGANDFEAGLVRFDHCKFLTYERAMQFRKGIAKDGDVLFAHNATVGPVALLSTNETFVILSTTVTYFRCSLEKLNNLYLKAAIQSEPFVRQYQSVMAQSTRFQVPITAQRKLKLFIPPLLEQRSISAVLSDMDELLEMLDRLITKKRDLKQATMQQLLTGKKRLPGFENRLWQLSKIGDLFEITAGGDLLKSEYSEVNSNNHPYPIYANSVYDSGIYGYSSFKDYEDGCVTVTARGTLGVAFYRSIPFVAIGRLLVLKPKTELDSFFLSEVINHLVKFANESTSIPQLTAPQIAKYELSIPSVEEQTAIAQILSDMDTEITTLEQRRDKTRNLKQGMMQELLTGRIRLKIETST